MYPSPRSRLPAILVSYPQHSRYLFELACLWLMPLTATPELRWPESYVHTIAVDCISQTFDTLQWGQGVARYASLTHNRYVPLTWRDTTCNTGSLVRSSAWKASTALLVHHGPPWYAPRPRGISPVCRITSCRVDPHRRPCRIRVQMDCSCVQLLHVLDQGIGASRNGLVPSTPRLRTTDTVLQPTFIPCNKFAATVEAAWVIAHFPNTGSLPRIRHASILFLQTSHTVGTSAVNVLIVDRLHEPSRSDWEPVRLWLLT
jgi:hypothetical protein